MTDSNHTTTGYRSEDIAREYGIALEIVERDEQVSQVIRQGAAGRPVPHYADVHKAGIARAYKIMLGTVEHVSTSAALDIKEALKGSIASAKRLDDAWGQKDKSPRERAMVSVIEAVAEGARTPDMPACNIAGRPLWAVQALMAGAYLSSHVRAFQSDPRGLQIILSAERIVVKIDREAEAMREQAKAA